MSAPGRVRWAHRIVALAAHAYFFLVEKTSFVIRSDAPSYLAIRRERRAALYVFWHNSQAFAAYDHRGDQASVIVSQSKDGEYIAQFMRRLRLNPIRGSSSRGGDKAFRELIQRLERGEQAGITPDGPRGPVGTVHRGAVVAALKTGVPVVPVTIAAQPALRFNSWDRFVLPVPFSRIVVGHGKPFCVPAGTTEPDAEDRIRRAIDEEVERAQSVLTAAPSWIALLIAAALYGIYAAFVTLGAPALFGVAALTYGVRRTFSHAGERFGRGVCVRDRALWFHAASVGEWQALKPLLAKFRGANADAIVLSVSTPEVRRLIQSEEPDVPVHLAPIDSPWFIRRWLGSARVNALVIVETELWPALIHELARRHTPVFLVNGRLSEKSVRGWKWLKPLSARVMRDLAFIYARSATDAERFRSLGAAHVLVTGNLKYDALPVLSIEDKMTRRRDLFGGLADVLLIGGSTWPGEDELLLQAWKEMGTKPVRLILAPRRKERRAEVEALLRGSGEPWSRWSDVKVSKQWTTSLLLVDTFGDLPDLYAASDAAFVGGTVYPKGGQNPLEPAGARVPIVLGPSTGNFQDETAQLLAAGGASQGSTPAEIVSLLNRIVDNPDERRAMGQAAAGVVQKNQGAVDRTYKELYGRLV